MDSAAGNHLVTWSWGILMHSFLTVLVTCGALATEEPSGARETICPALVTGELSGARGILYPQWEVARDDAELAGLAAGSRPVILTWERAYALALVVNRARQPGQGGNLAASLDLGDLTERALRYGVADFARFREDFLASDTGTGKAEAKFRDPSENMFELLRRLGSVENMQRNVVAHEQLIRYIRERIQGESSGLSQLDLDRVDAALQRARRSLSDEILHYRDKLDEFKVELGLSPQAPIAPDRGTLAAFHNVFAVIEDWSRDPRRNLTDLPRIIARLPGLKDVVIDGPPIFAMLDKNPDRLEDVLDTGSGVAVKNRRDLAKAPALDPRGIPLELRVRRRLRHLIETRLAYLQQMRNFVLAIRSSDQAFERLVAPPTGGPFLPRTPMLKEVLDQEAQILCIRNDLVALWTSFQVERLALYRDLGTLPCDDWKSFYEQLSVTPGESGQGPKAPAAPFPPPIPLVPAPPPP